LTANAAINITDFGINDIKNNLPEGVTLPPELEGLPIPSAENATKLFKEKCTKESGSDAAYEQVSVSLRFNDFFHIYCMTHVIQTVLKTEIL
jgi:hypothetical protein